MNKYEIIFNTLQKKVDNGELTLEKASEINDLAYEKYVTESFFKNPLKDKLKELEKIKDAKPSEYDDNKEIKKFVDDNYNEIVKASKLLQKEPEELTKNDRKFIVSYAVAFIGYIGGLVALSVSFVGIPIMVLSLIWIIVSSFINIIIRNSRVDADVQAMHDLSKVKTALKKLNTKKLPDAYKKKVSDLIQKIDDAEVDVYAKFKNIKESTYDDIADYIQESVNNGELTFEEAKDMNITAYEKMVNND